MSFRYSDYSEIIDYLLSQNYKSTLDWFTFPKENLLLLRHDVDVIPELCLPLADIEEKHGCRSSWFFLEANGIYSIYDSYTTEIVNELNKRGHSVQLHLDASKAKSPEQLASLIDKTVLKWSDCFGYEPTCFSFHRPAAFDLLPKTLDYRWHDKLRCAYDGDIFLGAVYVSDSNRRPLTINNFNNKTEGHRSLQLVTHPVWWAQNELQPEEVKSRILQCANDRVNRILKNNIKLFNT